MTAAHAVSIAVTFTWLGMVIAISFLEAPLKFRAPGVTVPLGLGIGRPGWWWRARPRSRCSWCSWSGSGPG